MIFFKPDAGTPCDNCQDAELPKVGILSKTGKPQVVLCPRCIAQALEAGTGWRVRNVVESWIKQSNRYPTAR